MSFRRSLGLACGERRGLVLLACALAFPPMARGQSAAPIATSPACEVALAGPIAITIPEAFDAEARSTAVGERIFSILRQDAGALGAEAAMLAIRSETRPFIDATSTYLQVRSNYPTLPERESPLDLTKILYHQLLDRLEELKRLRESPVEFNWRTFRKEAKAGEPGPQLIQSIRYLHYNLRAARERLNQDAEHWPTVFLQSEQLHAGIIQVDKFLSSISDRLDRIEVSLDLRFRLDTLRDDVRNLAQLIEGVHANTQISIRRAGALTDEIDSLLSLGLSAFAIVGDRTIDLSPLAPPDAARGDLSSSPALETSVVAIIDLALRSESSRGTKEVLVGFVRANAGGLSPTQVLRLAGCTWFDHVANEVLETFVRLARPRLTTEVLIELSRAARGPTARQTILDQISSPSEALTLAAPAGQLEITRDCQAHEAVDVR